MYSLTLLLPDWSLIYLAAKGVEFSIISGRKSYR